MLGGRVGGGWVGGGWAGGLVGGAAAQGSVGVRKQTQKKPKGGIADWDLAGSNFDKLIVKGGGSPLLPPTAQISPLNRKRAWPKKRNRGQLVNHPRFSELCPRATCCLQRRHTSHHAAPLHLSQTTAAERTVPTTETASCSAVRSAVRTPSSHAARLLPVWRQQTNGILLVSRAYRSRCVRTRETKLPTRETELLGASVGCDNPDPARPRYSVARGRPQTAFCGPLLLFVAAAPSICGSRGRGSFGFFHDPPDPPLDTSVSVLPRQRPVPECPRANRAQRSYLSPGNDERTAFASAGKVLACVLVCPPQATHAWRRRRLCYPYQQRR